MVVDQAVIALPTEVHGVDVAGIDQANAGHDLTVANLAPLVRHIPELAEVSIGHALFCDALTFGLSETVRRYLNACSGHDAQSA